LTIGDVSDGIFDSAVFIKAGTLGTEPPPVQPPNGGVPVPEPASVLLVGSGVVMAARRIKRIR
jgi:hypothetical protein